MGEYKDINDTIHYKLIEVLEEEGYEDIESNTVVINEMCRLIDAKHQNNEEFEELKNHIIQFIENNK